MVILTSARNCFKSIRGDSLKKFGNFNKTLINKSTSTDYIDSLRLKVVGGCGGHGCPVSKGIGGSGGNVIIEASTEVEDLSHVKKAFPDSVAEAIKGLDGRKTRPFGPNGTDCTIKVPCGITVFNEYLSPISELVKNGDKTIVAHGGIGGNIRTNYFGSGGQSQLITLDLRCLADIGLVGYPDSGKSLLWTKLTSNSDQLLLPEQATKKIKSKRPWLQDIKYDDGRLISCVDLPSLIEGAHRTDKSGHNWLKHLYRNQMILFVIDVTGFNRGIYRKPIETLLALNKQIEIYDDRYLTKPTIIVINKMDLPGADVAFEEFLFTLKSVYSTSTNNQMDNLDKTIIPKKLIYYQDIIPISCHRSRNINYLKQRIRELIDFNYLKSRNPDYHRSFVSLLETINESRAKVRTQLV